MAGRVLAVVNVGITRVASESLQTFTGKAALEVGAQSLILARRGFKALVDILITEIALISAVTGTGKRGLFGHTALDPRTVCIRGYFSRSAVGTISVPIGLTPIVQCGHFSMTVFIVTGVSALT